MATLYEDSYFQYLRGYLRYLLSYRNLEGMMEEQEVDVDYTTIYQWIQHFASQFEKKVRPYAKSLGLSWYADETHIKIKDQ